MGGFAIRDTLQQGLDTMHEKMVPTISQSSGQLPNASSQELFISSRSSLSSVHSDTRLSSGPFSARTSLGSIPASGAQAVGSMTLRSARGARSGEVQPSSRVLTSVPEQRKRTGSGSADQIMPIRTSMASRFSP